MKGLLLAPLIFVRLVYQSAYLALGQIWANKTRSILTTIGIVIGVASVTAVIAALTGLKTKILSEMETLGSNTIFISPWRPNTGPMSGLPWWYIRFKNQELDELLEHCPSVERYTRVCWAGEYTVKYGEKSVPAVETRGVDSAWHKIEYWTILAGRELSEIDEGQAVCLIEPKLRDKLGLDKECVGEPIRIGYRIFRVIGVVERPPRAVIEGGRQEYYEIIIPFKTALKLRRWHWIEVMAASKTTELSDDAVLEIKFFLRRTRHIKPGDPDTFRVETMKSVIEKFNNIAIIVTLVAGGIVGISLLVGGVGIMNIMLVSISERTKEIGLRKAVGAKRSAILTQFLVEAVVLCFVGGLVGVGVGKLLTLAIASTNPMLEKTYIPAWAIVLSFAFAGTVGICFGMFPAIKAARLDPIEALRHE
jgi:putative ABC transport system permease protein